MSHEMPTMDGIENEAEIEEKSQTLQEVMAEKVKELSGIKPTELAKNPTLQAQKAQLEMELSLLKSFPNDEAY